MVRHRAQNVSSKPRTSDVQISEDIDFKSMLLPQHILEGLRKSGYKKPSPIQKKALPLVRCGLDLVIQAKAGTGKTCVFTVAVLELVKPSLPHLQAIVLAPTREIALQITSVIEAIGQCVKGLKTSCFIGGYPLSVDVQKVKDCHVAVAAPGRLKHLLDKGLLNPHHVRLFVLDEADKLMEKIFIEDINAIFSALPESKQVLACSATYTERLVDMLCSYMNTGRVVSTHQSVSPSLLLGVRQFVSVIHRHVDRLAQLKLKEKHLLYLLRSVSFNQCLVFSNLHTRAVSLCSILRKEGWGVEWIAGRQEQKDRVAALTQLRDQRVRVLVTTDLTARGIDVENINLVINLDLPLNYQTYLHRMGRAGRYGSHGIVITMVSDGQELTGFQKLIGMISGTAQSVNRVPQNLKNIDIWTMSDDKFEKIAGIIENKTSPTSTSEKAEGSTSTSEKQSPEISDSEDYVKEYKVAPEDSDSEGYVKEYKGFDKESDSDGYIKEYKGKNGAIESSDSEDYVKEFKGENSARQSNGVMDSAESGEHQHVPTANTRDESVETRDKDSDSTSSGEKFSRDSSDGESLADECGKSESISSEYPCVCSLFEADSADIKVIAGPSLFALKKEDHWREVLPVIVNVSKVPLNTPIVLLDFKLIRVRFWDKTQRLDRNIEVDVPSKEIISLDTKTEDKDIFSFVDIVSSLENEIEKEDPITCIHTNTDIVPLSFENIEEALESGFCDIDESFRIKLDEVEKVLMKYNQIKEKSEKSLISFDSFDLVGWLAVDEMRNIVEEINIDECQVFIFNLAACLDGKHHIEVLSPPKGSSKETHDYIDHITTLNVESFSLTGPVLLSDIAKYLENCLTKNVSNANPHMKPANVTNPMPKEKQFHDQSQETKVKYSLNSTVKVPIISNSDKKRYAMKDGKSDSVNDRWKGSSSSSKHSVSSNVSNRNLQTNSRNVGLSAIGNVKGEKVIPENQNKPNKYEKRKHDNQNKDNYFFPNKSGIDNFTGKQQYHDASDASDHSGSYVEMSCNPLKDVSHRSKARSKTNHQTESKIQNKVNGFGHSQKHRNSDDSYDSYDSIEYETTDKEVCHRTLNENGTQRRHLYTKLHEPSNRNPNVKLTKLKVLDTTQERSKSKDFRAKSKNDSKGKYSSIECENIKPNSKSFLEVPPRTEQKTKNRYSLEQRHKTLRSDVEKSYKESYSHNCIENEISKLRALNSKLHHQDEAKIKRHLGLRPKQMQNVSEDDSSSESGESNRHSFRTACSQRLSEDPDHLHGETSDRSSRSSNYSYDNRFGNQFHSDWGQSKYDRHSRKHEYFQTKKHQEGRLPHEQEYPQYSYENNEGYEYTEFYNHQHYHPQDFSNLPVGGSSQILRGGNLHREWYSNWYLRVRQKAMQLATMEYTKTMSTL